MPNTDKRELYGRISSTNSKGTCGVVELSRRYGKFSLAVVNGSTNGRLEMMSASEDGRLRVDTKVFITPGDEGIDALKAATIRPA